MRGVLREVDRIPSWFIIVSANDHPRVIPLPARGREGAGLWSCSLQPLSGLPLHVLTRRWLGGEAAGAGFSLPWT